MEERPEEEKQKPLFICLLLKGSINILGTRESHFEELLNSLNGLSSQEQKKSILRYLEQLIMDPNTSLRLPLGRSIGSVT